MISIRLLALMIVIFVTVGALVAQDKHKMTKADVERQVEELSNWGRWGKEDQLGALNLITPEKRVQAAQLVKKGISVSLARDVEKDAAVDNSSPFQHDMIQIGRGTTGPWASDKFSVDYHGFAHTHMDSLCHLFYKGKNYNGLSRDKVGPKGAEVLSIRNVKQGIFTRGILFDIPLLHGVRFLKPGTAIYPEDLDAWEKKAKVKVASGDVVFINTGRWARRDMTGPWSVDKEGAAGLHASCAKWLKDRDIALLWVTTFWTFVREFSPLGPMPVPTWQPRTVASPRARRCSDVSCLALSKPRVLRPRTARVPAGPAQLRLTVTSSHALQVRFRLASARAWRASCRAASSSPGILSPVPKYISSGVCPRNAECGSRALCSCT